MNIQKEFMKLKKGISVCIITKNEENAIANCISSLSWANEVIVLDSFSEDRTLEIAKKMNARIYKRKFDNFAQQKNVCISYAKYEWVLSVDADEVVTENLSRQILQLLNNENIKYNGYKIPRITLYLNQWIKHSGWYPNYSIRLFKKNSGKFCSSAVHEKVIVTGKVGKINFPLLHYSYRNISEHINKINFYSTLIANEKFSQGESSSVLWAILKSISKFILTYFWRLGILDGKVGLIISVLGGYYNFQKYIKLWELKNKN